MSVVRDRVVWCKHRRAVRCFDQFTRVLNPLKQAHYPFVYEVSRIAIRVGSLPVRVRSIQRCHSSRLTVPFRATTSIQGSSSPFVRRCLSGGGSFVRPPTTASVQSCRLNCDMIKIWSLFARIYLRLTVVPPQPDSRNGGDNSFRVQSAG